MQINGIDIPDVLTTAIEEDRLVVFAGAGVSMQPPDPLPDFTQLIDSLARTSSVDGQVTPRFEGERYESYLGRIGNPTQLKRDCAHIMGAGRASELHANIVRLFEGGVARIVTTNYDLRFEEAANHLGMYLRTFSSPALPLGNDINGIVHLHGDIRQPSEMILVDSDFGSAYVSDGWVARFLVKMFARYTVLFVGYSLRDMPLQYLARSISTELEDRVFVLEPDVAWFTRWRARGITPIRFERYDQLPELFREWRLRVLRTPSERSQAVERISAATDPLTDYDVETLRKAFEDPDPGHRRAYAESFARAAHGFESLETLVALGYGGLLFEKGDEPRDEVLRRWAADAFAVEHHHELILLAEEAHRPFYGRFQRLVLEHLAACEVGDACLAFWAPFLDARAMGAAGVSASTLAQVIGQCIHPEVALAYIRKAFSMHAALWRNADGMPPELPVARFDIDLSSGLHELQRAIARHAEPLEMQLFLLCVDSLEEMEAIQTLQWQRVPVASGEARIDGTAGTAEVLEDLCLTLGRRLVADATVRESVIETCEGSRASVLRRVGRLLRIHVEGGIS